MLVVQCINVSDMQEVSDYQYEVWVTLKNGDKYILSSGTVVRHRRSDGWKDLIQRVVDEAKVEEGK